LAAFRRPERTGRPLRSEVFVEKVGVLIGRDLQRKKPGGIVEKEGLPKNLWVRFKDKFFAFQPRHGFEKKPLTLPSPPGRGKKRPIFQERAAQHQKAKGKRISSPGGEGRVRGLFPGMGEQNNEVKPAPGKRGDFRRSKRCKWRCIIRSAICLSRNPPTNSFEEAKRRFL